MESDGFDAEEVNEALAYQKSMFKYFRNEIDSNEFKQISEQTKQKNWAPGSYVTFFDNKKYINQWQYRYDFDPVPYLNKSKVPMLIVYGENDLIAPPKYNFPIIKKVFEKNPNSQNQLILYENANHLFMLGENRGDLQMTEIKGYAPELFNKITDWVLKQFEMERKI
jgi:pimeloyl-ACP methyl ester carboxylesterase